MPDPLAFDKFIRAQGLALHAEDKPPATRKVWEDRRAELRKAMFAVIGPFPDKETPLEPKELGVLKRDGYRIEKLIFQSRPDVWVTASAYVPEGLKGKAPAVLVVHGHWAWARRDPVVQARCLGLVKLGFFVLAVDAFGAGERFTTPGRGTYHGALYGSTLWPTGQTLLGMQVYDNRRAIDYLRSRSEVDGDLLGVTGASGGGNQSMYAGALDERIRAVVPVCSVGTYQAYLHAACCVCEVLPGALRFCEEGDVLGLVAPRALLVINATKDGFQFSVGEAEKSIARARPIFKLFGVEEKLRHSTFESPHDYNQAMREAMYGWMTRWLKNEGEGKPIAEPKHQIEKPEDLNCFPDGTHPKGFHFPPSFAAVEARSLLAPLDKLKPTHAEEWESTATAMRRKLQKEVLGDFPKLEKPQEKSGKAETADGVAITPLLLHPEPGMPVSVLLKSKADAKEKMPAAVVLDLKGKSEAVKHPLVKALLEKGWMVAAPDLRATGETRPANDAVRDAPDHNSTEHALWIGRPLLGQWVVDVQYLLDWLAVQPHLDRRRFSVVGIGQAGVVAICAVGLLDDRIASVAALKAPTSYVTDKPYAAGTSMGLLAPGILRVGDIPHLAALAAPRRLIVAGGITPSGAALEEESLKEAFAFTSEIYRLTRAAGKLTVGRELKIDEIAASL